MFSWATVRSGRAAAGTTTPLVVRHTVATLSSSVSICLVAPGGISRAQVGGRVAAAVGQLRGVDALFCPYRRDSLVSAVRRGELSPSQYPPPLVAVVSRCALLRALTDGWFDAWTAHGGFDPSAVTLGWAVDLAADLFTEAGIGDFAISLTGAGGSGGHRVSGHSPGGGPWRAAVRRPGSADALEPLPLHTVELPDGAVAMAGSGSIVDPHTGWPVPARPATFVAGPALGTARGYAVALYAAGAAGLEWFPTVDGYDVVELPAG